MQKIRISYNPYKMKTVVLVNGTNVCETDDYLQFREFIETDTPLQTWAEPIPYKNWKGIINELATEECYDEIEILPGIDRSISDKTIAEGARFVTRHYRNRRLGEFLKELDLSEGHSSGIPTIQDELKRNGSPRAEFFTDEDRRAMRIRIPIHPTFLPESNNIAQIEDENERSLSEVLSEVLKKSELKNIQPIIEILQTERKITPKEAIDACGKSAATIRRYFNILIKTGYVVCEGSTNNVIYKVKDN